MRILHYVDENNLAWGEEWIQLLKELARQGMSNHVACKPGGTLQARLAEEGIAVSTANKPWAWLPGGLGRIIDRVCPDIIHTRLSSAALIGGRWGRIKKIPVAESVDKFPKARYHKNADFLLPCSGEVKKHMLSLGFSESKMRVIFNPLDTARYKPDPAVRAAKRSEFGLSDGRLLIMAAGRFVNWKGFDILISAYAGYLGINPAARAGTKLLLAGDGEERTALLRLVKASGIEDNVIMPGFVSDIRPYLQASDIFVLPSKTPEPFGIVLLEALASGTACIATRGGGALDMITDGENGWFADINSAGSLGALLARAAGKDGKAERERIAAAGLKRAECFGVEKIAAQLISVYREISRNKQQPT